MLDAGKLKDLAPGEGAATGAFAEHFDTSDWVDVPVPGDVHRALLAAGHDSSPRDSDTLHSDADPATVGRVALAAGIALSELRPADGAGLEERFLALTAESQREGTAA